MAKFDYSGVYATAARLINAFGAEFTMTRPDSSYVESYDPITGSKVWTNAAGDVSYVPPMQSFTADGVIVGFTDEERYNTSVERGDKKLLTVTLAPPKVGDVFTVGVTEYSYVDHETIQPSSDTDPLLYKIQLRV